MKCNILCRRSLLLLGSVSALSMVSACEEAGVKNPFASSRPDQNLVGGRRAPLLNQDLAAKAQANASAAPKQPVKGNLDTNPYDYFDENGNVREEESAAVPAPMVTSHSSQAAPVVPSGAVAAEDNFFTRLWDKMKNPPPAADAPRKPLSGNPRYSYETETVAPVPLVPAAPQAEASPVPPGKAFPDDAIVRWNPAAPSSMVPLVPKAQPPKPSGKVEPAAEDMPKEPVKEAEKAAPQDAAENAPAQETGGEVPLWADGWLTKDGKESAPDEQQSAAAQESLALSSVPEVPEAFKAVKAQKAQEIEELQRERDDAEQAKQALAAEPSEIGVEPRAALLGESAAPLPPDTAPPPGTVIAPPKRNWWDSVFPSGKGSSKDAPAPGDAPAASGLPDPHVLNDIKPRPSPQ